VVRCQAAFRVWFGLPWAAISGFHGSAWAPRARPARLPATYHRTHGIRYFHGCYSLGDDQLWGITRRRKGGGHTLAALKSIRAARPDGAPIYVIMDNLSANKTPPIGTWAGKNKVHLCFTPTSASWANPIEAQFGPLRTFTMGGPDHPNHTVLGRRLQAYLTWRNANARHPASSPPSAASAHASAANASNAGAAHGQRPHDQNRRTFMDTALATQRVAREAVGVDVVVGRADVDESAGDGRRGVGDLSGRALPFGSARDGGARAVRRRLPR
jgi:hypothetical protein